MKKTLLSSSIILVILSLFTSCRKDHECKCSFDDGMGGRASQSFLIKSYKNDAKAACATYVKNYAQMSNVSCAIK